MTSPRQRPLPGLRCTSRGCTGPGRCECEHEEYAERSLGLYHAYHLHKALSITPTVTGQAFGCPGVPAMRAIRGGRVDHDGPSGLAHGRKIILPIVSLRRSATSMKLGRGLWLAKLQATDREEELTARMTGALVVMFPGKSMYISSPAGLLPKSVTWTRSPWTVAARQSPEKMQDFEARTMIADIALDIECWRSGTVPRHPSFPARLHTQTYIDILMSISTCDTDTSLN